MKITVKLDYACRILCELARHYAKGVPVSIERLSETEDVPANYLAQILGELKNGKLVVSRRGKEGGFLLARAAAQISIYDVVQVIEGDLLELSGNHGGNSGRALREVWNDVRGAATERAKAHTLESLIARSGSDEYQI